MEYESYVHLDDLTNSSEQGDMYLHEAKTAHAPCVLIILQSIHHISKVQFKRNVDWIAPMLSTLSVVNDRVIRMDVKAIYDTHLNPLVILLIHDSN